MQAASKIQKKQKQQAKKPGHNYGASGTITSGTASSLAFSHVQ
jgi:hypothetical protein